MAHGSHGGGGHGHGMFELAGLSAIPGFRLLLLFFVLVVICGG
jgi:hypothetical protein